MCPSLYPYLFLPLLHTHIHTNTRAKTIQRTFNQLHIKNFRHCRDVKGGQNYSIYVNSINRKLFFYSLSTFLISCSWSGCDHTSKHQIKVTRTEISQYPEQRRAYVCPSLSEAKSGVRKNVIYDWHYYSEEHLIQGGLCNFWHLWRHIID